ncbi:hypothetical protein V7146_11485 [Gottfriedia acidiceleris]|uniref:hypothetical protein n=1 Tax=Gottfriedia acidiceleris TaxID=371036 RepID=UPI002FFE7A0E
MKELTKQEFAFITGVDGTKNGSAWQTEERKASSICAFEKNGKVGRGARYIIIEKYETPKVIAHGNKGKAPHNKGVRNPTALKYKLAQAIIKLGSEDNFQSRKYYFTRIGLESKNLYTIAKMFQKSVYKEMDHVEQLVFSEVNKILFATSRLWSEALELIKEGEFETVKLKEKYVVALSDGSHREPEKVFKKNWLKMLGKYEQAKDEAAKIVKEKYGEKLFFSTRTYLIDIEYQRLIQKVPQLNFLYDEGIKHFYKSYAIDGNLQDDVNYVDEMFFNYMKHRKHCTKKTINKLCESKTFMGNKKVLMKFAEELVELLFRNDTPQEFKKKYESMIENVKNANKTEIELYNHADDLMELLPFA